jgi:hypothetical protein
MGLGLRGRSARRDVMKITTTRELVPLTLLSAHC